MPRGWLRLCCLRRARRCCLVPDCLAPSQNAIARDDRWPRIVVYPEGNTCNGRQICGFKARRARCLFFVPWPCPLTCRRSLQLGPFQPGMPVQPMVISYARNKRLDPCWVEPAGLPVHIVAARLLLQFHNFMEARAKHHQHTPMRCVLTR